MPSTTGGTTTASPHDVPGAVRCRGSRPPDDLSRDEQACRLLRQAASSPPSSAERLREEVILLNLELARSVSRRFRGRGIDEEDLEQVAYLGLCKAVKRFREPAPRGFAAYAVPTISGELKRHFRDRGWLVRPPRGLQESALACRAADDELAQRLGRVPTRADLAAHLGVSDDQVDAALVAAHHYSGVSFESVPGTDRPGSCDRLGTVEESYDELEWRLVLDGLLEELPPRDQLVMQLRFRHGATQREIGQTVGISQMQVSRVLGRVLQTLRDHLTEAPGP